MKDIFTDNASKRKLAQKFEHIFGVPFNKYFDNIYGFNILAFDDDVTKAPDGKSIEDVVRERYSQEAVDLIWELL